MKTVPAFVLAAGLAAVVMIVVLQQRSDASRRAQVELEHVSVGLNQIQWAPIDGMFGMPAARVRAQMRIVQAQVASSIADLQRRSPTTALDGIEAELHGSFAADGRMLAMLNQLNTPAGRAAIAGWLADRDAAGLPPEITQPLARAQAEDAVLSRTLGRAGDEYAARASRAKLQAMLGSSAAIALLVLAFGLTYRRSLRARAEAERFAAENAMLAEANRQEAITDALTGLGNRRALIDELQATVRAGAEAPVALALFDLDGFKQYNDSFGHPAGDALLCRLGERLTETLDGIGSAFRMGGDEFCVLAPVAEDEADAIARLAASALSESGDAFTIGCSYGVALVPAEASTAEEALRLADQRMYEQKRSDRRSASRQSTDVLLQVLTERNRELEHHVKGVADLAVRTAERLGLADQEIRHVQLAAQLHDVGKSAIPETILAKPGPLDEVEWGFMRRHTAIGERIVLAAPSLAHAAGLVRSSHERVDGTGYPDGLAGDAIPLGARIIAVCDAFDSITGTRPYRATRSTDEAVEELRRCAGTQFDPAVVDAFCAVVGATADRTGG